MIYPHKYHILADCSASELASSQLLCERPLIQASVGLFHLPIRIIKIDTNGGSDSIIEKDPG